MSNLPVAQQVNALAGNENMDQFIRRVMFPGVTSDKLKLTLLMCQQYGLDPLLKHVVVIKFGNREMPYITRDGLLHVAHKSGQLDGMTVNFGTDAEDMWAECTVWRKDASHPFVYRVYASEYNSDQNAWKTHPRSMLAKTAEVFTLRRAFNVAMSTLEEMDSAITTQHGQVIEAVDSEVIDVTPTPPQHAKPATAQPSAGEATTQPAAAPANVTPIGAAIPSAKAERPLQAGQLYDMFRRKAEGKKLKTACSLKQQELIRIRLQQHLTDEERHFLLFKTWEKPSSKDLLVNRMETLLEWLDSDPVMVQKEVAFIKADYARVQAESPDLDAAFASAAAETGV